MTRHLRHTGSVPLATVLTVLMGCASTPGPDSTAAVVSPQSDCSAFIEAVDGHIETAGLGWPSAYRVPGHPGLRSNRFLAAIAERAIAGGATSAWIEAMRDLDRRARTFELARLSAADRHRLTPGNTPLGPALETCLTDEVAALPRDPGTVSGLVKAARVPDDYSLAARTFGLYPLTLIPVAEGVRRLHNRTRARFEQPVGDAESGIQPTRYAPHAPAPMILTPIGRERDALGRPTLDGDHLSSLFDHHAPIWEIVDTGPYDVPGQPTWRAPGVPGLDTHRAVAYTYPSWTFWQGQVLLQLNYVIWFSERPPDRALDILAGPMDGLLWRVTLLPDGRPLVYDSIHPCGCYHMLFPKPGLRLRAGVLDQPEPPLVAAVAPEWRAGTRTVLRIASRSHYLEGLYRDTPGTARPYALLDYDLLDRIPDADGRPVGLFDPDGLVAGSQRPERWILWPMGVKSAGAMRTRGRHAIAFVGRRHFDDPNLLNAVFETPRAVTARVSPKDW
jgi:hypothetical protein